MGSLLLSREHGETIRLRLGNTTVEVKVEDFPKRGRVRLRVTAPPDVLILRGELVGRERRKDGAA